MVFRSVKGDSATAVGSIPVDYVSSVRKKTENLPDRTVDKYSLILFDFDKATLTEDNSRILEQMVLPNIASTSKVKIIGYTDRIGNDVYNEKLSRERAETVKAFLMSRAKDAKYSTSGVGEGTEIFPNDVPVGRQLSRTVQVIVETPRR
ncbi:MAG: OmpA family protein [Candidatus Kapabacteria bacterium]|nr:OmpA family protein [Candidatus Kapabacteria bacterium]